MSHLINKLQFEVSCPDEELALNLRYNFSLTYQEQIMEVVDRVCSKYVDDKEWLRIDKLEIDLGKFSPQGFNTRFSEVFLAKFEQAFQQKLAGISLVQRQQARQLSYAEMWQHFLLKGSLPWWVDETELNLQEVTAQLLQQQPAAMLDFFQAQRAHPHLWQRLALQFSNDIKAQIITLFPALANAQGLLQEWQQTIRARAVPALAAASPEKIVNLILESAPLLLQATADKNVVWQVFADHLPNLFIITPEQESSVVEPLLVTLAIEKGLQLPDATPTAVKKEALLPGSLFQTDYNTHAEEEQYTVRHAGVILLAAFLRPFFTTLELWDGKEWKSKDACYRAVHLLKYLCTGQQQAPEYSLVMEKICCGLPLDEPVPLDLELTEKEIAESTLLLESIIGHWKMLKNTSVNGLRETFLKRDGILSRQEKNWRLQVEQKTLDVLLDSIPWGFSTISLPWNGYLIFVEW
ncbi:hypothetical protein SAMN04488505_102314 [Chitinophaga rupis]|uniref:Uncharacterized protein n=1 Tax=Chitinophaga rupis TaxID=573321 RepID=A0A1H7QD96_9BACT|nr:contractile injection system tape measure protein [Chitinophaga rupis]SEL45789.1 hypothetical protein SAMN04488505_102314 [Chitinophaga rupis]